MTADPAPPRPPVSLAVVNARVWTGDPRRPWADALAVRGDQLAAVGSSAEVRKLAGPAARVVDAKGATVVGAAVAGATGRLTRGDPADFSVLGAGVTPVPPEPVGDADVVMTVIGGRVVYEREHPSEATR